MYLPAKDILWKRSEKDLFDDDCAICFSDFLYKGICCGYSFELHGQVNAIQMSTHNICFYEEVDKKYTGCNLKTMELLDCAYRGMCRNWIEYGTLFTLSIWTPPHLIILWIWTIYYPMLCLKIVGCVANSVDPDECILRHLLRVYIVCSSLSVRKYTVNMVYSLTSLQSLPKKALPTYWAFNKYRSDR